MKRLLFNMTEVKHNQFENISVNLAATAKTRKDSMEERDFLVVPCVMITEGVHNGSNGPLYYPKEELAKTPEVWNHKPVVVYHPTFNGQGVSACDPAILTSQKIGVLMNTKFDSKTGQLKTECWLEEAKTRKVDDRVLNALEEGTVVEVSTGLYSDYEITEGEWNGEKYTAIARNYRPDHLAVLPDQIGACSIADGAGLLRNAAEKEDGAKSLLAQSFLAVFNELSHSDIWEKLNVLIRGTSEEMMGGWVSEVWGDFCIYERDGNFYYQEYEVKEKEVKLKGMPIKATKLRQYQLADGKIVGNKTTGKEKKKMDRKEMVDNLIADAKNPWAEEDREFLTGLNDAKWGAVIANVTPIEKPEPKTEPAVTNTAVTKPEPKAPVQTLEEFIANAPEKLRDVLRHGVSSHQREKAALISVITANERNQFTPEMLDTKSIEELNALAMLAAPVKETPAFKPMYFGMGETIATNAAVEEALPVPTLNFEAGK